MFHDAATLTKRQLWDVPSSTTHLSDVDLAHCTPFTLPSHGVISLASTVITLSSNVVFQPECTGVPDGVTSVLDLKDPFYASTIPQTYVIASTTVIAWILIMMLVITPRTSFMGGSGISPGFRNGHGIIGGSTGGSTSLIGVGSRPWLQKVAALTVAISLTIATVDTFKVARTQYLVGIMNASALRDEVLGSLEIRITRVISDIFVWLAQVQTLIRLFPRHKEKVLIKWIGFALIIFDTVFSCLDSFLVNNAPYRPRHFVDAIPALSYLFELALELLYAAWVIYYALTKRRYAFYHPKMRNICLIALLSLIAILTPVVFFVTDVSNENVAGWGDYFPWVGAVAASVVVWEWVERIEALERDEKKDGILGREIFDGDEMLEVTPSEEAIWSRHGRHRLRRGSDGDDGDGGNQTSALEHGLSAVAQKFRRKKHEAQQHFPLGGVHSSTAATTPEPRQAINGHARVAFDRLPRPSDHATEDSSVSGPTPPPVVASPVSRTDTTSAASTVYVVRYDTEQPDLPQPVRRRVEQDANDRPPHVHTQDRASNPAPQHDLQQYGAHNSEDAQPNHGREQRSKWHAVSHPFKRKRASPPAEVQQARQAAAAESATRAATPSHNFSRWDIKNQLGVLAAETGDRLRDRKVAKRQEVDLPLTIIPAQPRGSGRTWSPDDLNRHNTVLNASSGPGQAIRLGGLSSAAPRARAVDSGSPLNAGGTASPAPSSLRGQAAPPRADDISPGANGEIVIPAPRRSPLRRSATTDSYVLDSTSNSVPIEGSSPSRREDG